VFSARNLLDKVVTLGGSNNIGEDNIVTTGSGDGSSSHWRPTGDGSGEFYSFYPKYTRFGAYFSKNLNAFLNGIKSVHP